MLLQISLYFAVITVNYGKLLRQWYLWGSVQAMEWLSERLTDMFIKLIECQRNH